MPEMQACHVSRRLTLFLITIIVSATLSIASNDVTAATQSEGGNDVLFSSDDGGSSEKKQAKPFLSSFLSKFNVSGYLRNETAYRFDKPRTVTKIRNIAYLSANRFFGSRVKFTFSAWAYYDLAYDLINYDTIAARYVRDQNQPLVFLQDLPKEKDSPVAAIRELYFDIFLKNTDIRIGKQFVIWGVLEGVRVVDVINPINFRELILLPLLEYRVPLWTFKLDHYTSIGKFEFLWIPEAAHDIPAPRGSEWELLQLPPNTRVQNKYGLRESEVGLKYNFQLLDTDLSLSYWYGWDPFPTIFRNVRLNSSQVPAFFPTFTRLTLYGGTFVKQVGPVIVKGELAYVPNKYFGIRSVDTNGDGYLDNNGAVKKKHIRWGLGIDFNLFGADISPSFVQWVILDYEDRIIQHHYNSNFNLFIRRVFPQQSAVFSLLLIRLIDEKGDMYMQPKVTYNITDHFDIALGLDLFYGKPSVFGPQSANGGVAIVNTQNFEQAHFFGNFTNNNRIFANFTYTF